jgi:hypothetical protein
MIRIITFLVGVYLHTYEHINASLRMMITFLLLAILLQLKKQCILKYLQQQAPKDNIKHQIQVLIIPESISQ